jgi:hypothetical protein
MLTPLRHRLERLRHRQGELLRSRDFRDQQTIEAELRWWHNRALHNAYGIACGLVVTQAGTQVTVAPGLAYDCFGRELLLSHPVELTLPPAPPAVKLLIRYRETSNASCSGPPVGSCGCSASAGVPEHLELRWVDATRRFDPREGVPLPRISVHANGRVLAADPVEMRARPLARPRIATGSTTPGSSGWELWERLDDPATTLGFQITIDTSVAGFTRVPCYFASLEGPRWRVLADGSDPSLLLISDHIVHDSPTGFTFRVFAGLEQPDNRQPNAQRLPAFQAFAREHRLSVHWLGIQDDRHHRS